MRLFTCINFRPEIKDALFSVSDKLKCRCVSGNFSRRENLHLTLVFLGEIESAKLKTVESCVDNAAHEFEPFEIVIDGIGRFRRGGDTVIWIGVQENRMLQNLYRSMLKYFAGAGFTVEQGKYNPHITIARKAVYNVDFEELKETAHFAQLKEQADGIALMKSERLNGRLVYTELYKGRFAYREP